ncbi:neuropeptide prohormone-4-like isoform X2 [Lineus longissimus]|uniref:neuropeptide prohormone-4-like isoform X2 n=1 Tax=Lineus longissimus TaxID=88925 RepID=UPI002B4C5DF0
MKVWEQGVLLVVVVVASAAAMKIDLAKLIDQRHHKQQAAKRLGPNGDYNPCDLLEKPFPCKDATQCIPMKFVCDDNYDCDDGSDEARGLCTAIRRPPADDMKKFITKERAWILPHLLGNQNVEKIVHYLAVSPSIDVFRRRVGLNREQYKNLQLALKAIQNGDEEALQKMGMPDNAWEETKFMFGRLLKSGFY